MNIFSFFTIVKKKKKNHVVYRLQIRVHTLTESRVDDNELIKNETKQFLVVDVFGQSIIIYIYT